jgi:hypothetical protein
MRKKIDPKSKGKVSRAELGKGLGRLAAKGYSINMVGKGSASGGLWPRERGGVGDCGCNM